MSLNKQKGNMYPWVTHTWNPIGGKCPHQCSYCYMKMFKLGELELRERFLRDNLGKDRVIFVGSSCDMWAEEVPNEWIEKVLGRCLQFDNTYLFQSKNPTRFFGFGYPIPCILGTTLESNRDYHCSQAPSPWKRWQAMKSLLMQTMVSIEPIMDFDLEEFTNWLYALRPSFVSIGADSKGHKLPEPSGDKVTDLIAALETFTEVRPKKNLQRLMR